MSLDNLNWLWESQEKREGEAEPLAMGGDFTPGYTGHWVVDLLRSAWVEEGVDLDGLQIEYSAKNDIPGKGSFVYWHTEGMALRAQKDLGLRWPPRQVWRLEMPSITMVGFNGDNVVDTFGEAIGYDVAVVSPKSKRRVPFQMMAMPSMFHALGMLAGVIKEPIFDYESLVDTIPEDVTEEIEEQFVGTQTGYTQSDLWVARTKIWEALGEPNAMAYQKFGMGTEFDASSKDSAFNQLLDVVMNKTKIWAHLVRVPEPRVEAVTKDGKHLYVPVIAKVYRSQQEAEDDLGVEAGASAAYEDIELPEEWEAGNASVQDWVDFVIDLTKDKGNSLPVIKAKLNSEEVEQYGCTVEQVLSTWEKVHK